MEERSRLMTEEPYLTAEWAFQVNIDMLLGFQF